MSSTFCRVSYCKNSRCDHSKKRPSEQYFSVDLFIMLLKVVVYPGPGLFIFETVVKILSGVSSVIRESS